MEIWKCSLNWDKNMAEVLTICGSMRFEKQMREIAYLLEAQYGFTVLQCTYGTSIPTAEEKIALSQSHFHKIDLSNGIYVVDCGGYIGDSVQKEIQYAKSTGKHVYYHSTFTKEVHT